MTEPNLSEGLKRLNLSDFRKKINDLARRVTERQLQQIEKLAAAYIVETGISPIEAVLVEETSYEDGQMCVSWHFERQNTYKVFVWDNLASLGQAVAGTAWAIATCKEDAVDTIISKIKEPLFDPRVDRIRTELHEKNPSVVEMKDWPTAGWDWGSS